MTSTAQSLDHALAVRKIGVDRPWVWLQAGWNDLSRAPDVSLTYGALFVGASFMLSLVLWFADLIYLLLPLAAGFMLVGPILAVGLYDVSRRLERGQRPYMFLALRAWRANPGPILSMGAILMLFLLAWIRVALLIFALFFGLEPPSWDRLITAILFSVEGVPFLLVGTLVGGAFAALAFAISAVAIPILLDRDVGIPTAVFTSVSAVLRNWRVMIGWGALVTLFTVAGIVTFYVGLAVTLPLIGHATWHAYRDLVANGQG